MALPPTFKVDVFSDVGWKTNQILTLWNERIGGYHFQKKVAITNNVKGKKTIDEMPKPASLSLRVHCYDGVATFDFDQTNEGVFTLKFSVWAEIGFQAEITTLINS